MHFLIDTNHLFHAEISHMKFTLNKADRETHRILKSSINKDFWQLVVFLQENWTELNLENINVLGRSDENKDLKEKRPINSRAEF